MSLKKILEKDHLKNINNKKGPTLNATVDSSSDVLALPKAKRLKIEAYFYEYDKGNDAPSQKEKLSISQQVDLYIELIFLMVMVNSVH